MSRKHKRNQANKAPQGPLVQEVPGSSPIRRRNIFLASSIAVLLVVLAGTLLYKSEEARSSQHSLPENRSALASGQAPMFGKPDAKVHVVEFLDPACEACAAFYPYMKRVLAANPDKVRLSVRHVPFHKGADVLVRILEASRNQGRYGQTLEALLASQERWSIRHAVQPDRVWDSLGGFGLDLDRIRSDMNAPEISRRMERDMADARALGVTRTPELFVNGRQMQNLSLDEFHALVREELRKSYP